jgi:TIR domain-containing protein
VSATVSLLRDGIRVIWRVRNSPALKAKGLRVWYDDFSLKLGDSLRRSIDYGLARSLFGVVILSPHFFEKHWPQQELNGLATREVDGEKVILPVWHSINAEEVRKSSPMLADRKAVHTNEGLERVVQMILEVVKAD